MSASSLAKLAISECDSAEAFVRKVTVAGGNKVAVLAKPNIQGTATGEYLMPGEVADVIARAVSQKDGRVYLRLQTKTGWVTTRSRKDFAKIVIAGADGKDEPLEPPSAGASLPSRAMKLLPHVDEDGKELTAGEKQEDPVKFRAASSRCQILSAPHGRGGNTMAGALLPPREEFLADAVYMQAAEGRAYLRLQDGRGWVCERLRHAFGKFAVDPVDRTALGADFDATFEDEAAPSATASLLARARARLGDGGGARAVPAMFGGAGPAAPEEPAGPTAEERAAKRKREILAAAVKPMCFRSDTEIWPAPLGEPRAMKQEIRRRLRRLSLDFGARVQEMELDIREANERADSYTRACDNSRALRAHAEMLQKDVGKVQKEWAKAAEKIIADAKPGQLGDVVSLVMKRGLPPSDRDIWPCPLGEPPSLGPEVRRKLRSVFVEYGKRVNDIEDDLREIAEFIQEADAAAQATDEWKELRSHEEALRKELASVPKEWATAVEGVIADAASRAKASEGGDEGEPPQKKAKTSESGGELSADAEELRKRYEELYGHPPRGFGRSSVNWLQQKIQEHAQGAVEEDAKPDPGPDKWHVGPFKPAAEDAEGDLKRLRQAEGLQESTPIRLMVASAGA